MTKRIPWTPFCKALLALHFPTMLSSDCAKLLNRSQDSVESMASTLGIKKAPGVAGKLRQTGRHTAQPKQSGYLATLEPEKPTQRPADVMKGIWYGKSARVETGLPINGNALRRAAEHAG